MAAETSGIPQQPLGALFLRFLRFGALAWGGPVAQIAMIKRELVEEEKWITPEKFNRVYAVYQMLPGPEATGGRVGLWTMADCVIWFDGVELGGAR
jgi:chromate transporter